MKWFCQGEGELVEYKFQDNLFQMAEEFARLLKGEGIIAVTLQDTLCDYSVKLSISKGDRSFGNVNLYYSPNRNSYSFRTHELKDKSIVPELERCWQRFLYYDDVPCTGYCAYVDGAFIDGSAGYGVVIVKDGEIVEELSGSVPAEFIRNTRNIAGEIFAAIKAIEWCQRNAVSEVFIFHDCEGIEKWATGEWEAKHPLTQQYVESIRNCGVRIHWCKVNSHTGDLWNERADELAKNAIKRSSHRDTEMS